LKDREFPLPALVSVQQIAFNPTPVTIGANLCLCAGYLGQ
jgi:hypothetical protein